MATNGLLDVSTLVAVPGFDPYPDAPNYLGATVGTRSNLLTPEAARQYAGVRAAFLTAFGAPLTYAEAYRTLTMQKQRAAEHALGGPLAAEPGTSNHGWAVALDLRNDVGTKTGLTYKWCSRNLPAYGFVNDVATEGWHWHYIGDPKIIVSATQAASVGGETVITPTASAKKRDSDMLIPYAIVDNQTSKKVLGYVAYNTQKQKFVPSNYDEAVLLSVAFGVSIVQITNGQQSTISQIAAR